MSPSTPVFVCLGFLILNHYRWSRFIFSRFLWFPMVGFEPGPSCTRLILCYCPSPVQRYFETSSRWFAQAVCEATLKLKVLETQGRHWAFHPPSSVSSQARESYSRAPWAEFLGRCWGNKLVLLGSFVTKFFEAFIIFWIWLLCWLSNCCVNCLSTMVVVSFAVGSLLDATISLPFAFVTCVYL